MTTVAIHQPQYLPYLGFFHKVAHCDLFILLDDAQFQKNSHQNRNKIKSATGWQWLTVPVLHRFGQTINQVALNPNVDWAHKHWQALISSYGRAPFFDLYRTELKALLLEQTYKDLCSLDLTMLRWVMRTLDLEKPILVSLQLRVGGTQTARLVNLCKAAGSDCYLSGPGGRLYMDPEEFREEGIRVEFQNFESPTYVQVFPKQGFCSDLSVVDVLFNCGAEAREFLR